MSTRILAHPARAEKPRQSVQAGEFWRVSMGESVEAG